jgi:4'-phosphopantetheinyl transferase
LECEEQARDASLALPQVRNRFLAAPAAMRSLLGGVLDVDPDAMRFQDGPRGTPSLAGELWASGVTFNLSHSEEGAPLAIASGREVGVDIECIRSALDTELLAQRFLARSEHVWMPTTTPAAHLEAFFRCCWLPARLSARRSSKQLEPRQP